MLSWVKQNKEDACAVSSWCCMSVRSRWMHSLHYRKRGSASYIVREWLLWVVVVVVVVVERERERQRETPVTSSISPRNREWSCISLPWRCVDPMRRRVLSLSSARVHEKTRSFGAWALEQQGRVIDEWRWGSGSSAFSGQLLWITEEHFVGMLQARRIDQVYVYFLFEWHRFCLWKQLG